MLIEMHQELEQALSPVSDESSAGAATGESERDFWGSRYSDRPAELIPP